MARKQKISRKKLYFGAFLVVALLMVALYFGGAQQSIANDISVTSSDFHSSVSSAFNSCNSKRALAINSGQDCDPCALACSFAAEKQPDGLYDVDLSRISTAASGFARDLDCDYVNGVSVSSHDTSNPSFYKPFGAYPASVKSYCEDRIRVCEYQGIGEVIDEITVSGGIIKKIRYEYGFGECGSGEVTDIQGTRTKYKLECRSDYYVDGSKLESNINNLGSCKLRVTYDPEIDNRAGALGDINVPSKVKVGAEIIVTGNFLADGEGTYLLAGDMMVGDAFTTFSVFSASNPCGDSLQSSGVFTSLNAGQNTNFELSIQAPQNSGTYKLRVLALDSCSSVQVYDFEDFSIEVLDEETFEEVIIEELITEEKEFYEEWFNDIVKEAQEIIGNNECDPNEGLEITVENCLIGSCIGGNLEFYEEIQCEDGTVFKGDDVQNAASKNNFSKKLISFEKEGYAWYIVGAVLIVGILSVFIVGGKRK